MKNKQIFLVTVILSVLIYLSFIFFYGKYHKTAEQKAINNHAKVVANSLWIFNPDLAKDYLQLACQLNKYKKLVVTSLPDEMFITTGYDLEQPYDRFLRSLSLLNVISFSSDIEYKGDVIGRISVERYNTAVYTYVYAFIIATLLLIICWFITHTIKGKQELENRVKERTKALDKEIDERMRTEKTLRERDQRYAMATNAGHVGVWDWNIRTDEFYLDANLKAMLGYADNEIRNHMEDWIRFVHPDDSKQIMIAAENHIEGLTSQYQLVHRKLHKDGSIRWFLSRGTAIQRSGGKPHRIVGTDTDITDRRLAEEALQQSEEKYRLLVENATDAIFITQDEVIKFPNAKTVEILGYSEEELGKIPFIDLIHSDDQQEVINRHRKRLADKELSAISTFRIANRYGVELWVQLNAVLINWEGRPAVINFVRDITPQKKMEDQFIQSQKMEAIGTLAGGIAHDFNNILSSIIGYAELSLLNSPKDSEQYANLNEILASGLRAKDLVKQILTFSRRTEQEFKPVQVKLIVKEALKLLRASLPTTIEIHPDIRSNSLVEGDPTQVHQILMNLCTNAGHAMSEKSGVLKVSLENVTLDLDFIERHPEIGIGEYIRLTVSDTGEGISPENLEKIFDPYFTTKEKGSGTGLGLAVVHGIVEKYGGTIMVKSEMGKSSTFEVYLPILRAEPPRTQEFESPVLTGKESILFVDDEASITKLNKQVLDNLGYSVTTRTSSVEALELFRINSDKFDLVITDLTMPNMTGVELAVEILSIRSDIPIILCTGFSEFIGGEKVKQIGIRKFIMKPIARHILAQAIREALENRGTT
jgi:PAS domain S-box-containing protein